MTRRDPRETKIQSDIELAIGAEPDLLLLRNSCGLARFVNAATGHEYHVPYGLGAGSPDLVGILRVKELGVWFCLEVKRPGLDAEPHQKKCHAVWRTFGAFVRVVHSVDEAKRALHEAREEAAA
jgi:hypothetical protein